MGHGGPPWLNRNFSRVGHTAVGPPKYLTAIISWQQIELAAFCQLLLGRIACIIFCCTRCTFCGLSVCVLAALLSPANAAEPIEMPFVVQTPVEPRSRV